MSNASQDQAWPDLSELNRQEWAQALRELVEQHGEYLDLDDDHHVIQMGEGERLLVTFESAHDIRNGQEDALPIGLKMAQTLNVAVITVMCQRPTWFRAPTVFAFFDALTDDGVFDSFEHVAFFGTGLGGYAAAAFSVSAPGCDVVAVSPQATLDPRVAEWDPRFASARRFSWTDRYGFAPEMAEATRHTLVLYNPEDDLEAMHVSLFARDGITRFRCRHMGRDVTGALDDMRILNDTLRLALAGVLGEASFARLYRKRRDYAPYLRALLTETEDQDRPKLTSWLAESVLQRKNMPRMRRALERVQKAAEASAEASEAAE
ncbi:MAG: phosphoadenosine phosphosulfate reductase [Rhodobacteraceae bacterium]|nr:phosphoadenosine phosphosulfate reductase [Paracoccaceae bacterium]